MMLSIKENANVFFSGTSSIFSVIYRWKFNSFGIWNEWNKWAWDIFAPISVIDRPLTLKSCKIWNSLHSEAGVGEAVVVQEAKNIGAPIMPRPFQLFRCPFRFEMSTCGFGETRQTIRKYFKIPPLTIKCRSSVKSWDLWDPGVMSVDIDSLLLFRRQTAKTIDQLWDDYWDFVVAFL